MSLRFICIELREKLDCANVFLRFENNVDQLELLKINLNKDQLTVKETENCISFKLSPYFSFDTHTLSNLIVEKFNASFRFSVQDVKFCESEKTNEDTTLIQPLFEIGQSGNFVCSVCKCRLMDLDTLVRTREFPSGAIDSGEFFCHAATEFKDILVPRICDLYYGFDFVVVNKELLESTTKSKSDHIHCRRCLQHLGEILFNGKAAKLWVDSLKLNLEEHENEFGEVITKPTIIRLIRRIVKDCTGIDLIHSMNLAKVLFSTSFSNRSTKYLIMQILEKELKILRNETPFLHRNCNENNVQEEQLTDCKSYKVLYKYLEHHHFGDKEERLPTILQFWQQDISVQSLQISPNIFNSLLQQLEENSLLTPELYRYDKDGLMLSYLFYKD